MGYINKEFYKKRHKGKVADENLDALIGRASMLIDNLTHNRIEARGLEGLTSFQQRAVKRACCMIVDHMAAGAAPGLGVDSVWMADMRINMRRDKQKPWEAAGCGMWAWMTLLQTGLMRGSF